MKKVFLLLIFCFIISGVFAESNVSRMDALNSLSDSELIINELSGYGLSLDYFDDLLIEANLVFSQVEYARILSGDVSSTSEEKYEARRALRFTNWRELDYSNVLHYYDLIEENRNHAISLLDEMYIEESRLRPDLSNKTFSLFYFANESLYAGRYEESEEFLSGFRVSLEEDLTELSRQEGVRAGLKNFFQRYWIQITIFLVVFLLASYFIIKYVSRRRLRNKIIKMRAEKIVLKRLIKKAQDDRFNKNEISKSVYDIRIKSYKNKSREIDQSLSVLRKEFKK